VQNMEHGEGGEGGEEDGLQGGDVGVFVEENDEDDEDSDDDDGIKVTINQEQIEAAKTNYQTMQLKKSTVDSGFVPSHKEKKGKFAVEDFDAIGTVNGQPSVEVDLDSLEEKPWRKPGADITDYFNYGFTEDTWAAYCNRQRRMRLHESGAGLTGSSTIMSQNRLTGSVTGTIPTLGGQTGGLVTLGGEQGIKNLSVPPPTVKKDTEPSGITVMTHEKRVYSNKVMGNMDFSMPPPGFDPSLPPPAGAPPSESGSAPAPMGEFPPSDPFGEYGEGDPYQGGYEPTASAQWAVPPPAGTWSNNDGPSGAEQSYGSRDDRYRRSRDSRDDRYRDRGDYDRDRGRSSRRRSRSRSRDRDRRDRDRDRGDRDRDRDRDRDSDRDKKVKKEKRSRSRSKDRDRDRSRSPRHKKSKKDKKSREDKESPSRDKEVSKENQDMDQSNPSTLKVKEEPQDKEN